MDMCQSVNIFIWMDNLFAFWCCIFQTLLYMTLNFMDTSYTLCSLVMVAPFASNGLGYAYTMLIAMIRFYSLRKSRRNEDIDDKWIKVLFGVSTVVILILDFLYFFAVIQSGSYRSVTHEVSIKYSEHYIIENALISLTFSIAIWEMRPKVRTTFIQDCR